MGWGVTVKDEVVGVAVIKESFQKHLEIGGGQRQKLFVGRGYRGCHRPAPHKNFDCTHIESCDTFVMS